MNSLLSFILMIIPFVMTASWLMAGIVATDLPNAKNSRKLSSRITVLRVLSYIALAIGMLWFIAIMGQLFLKEWLFAEGTIKAIVPIVLLSHLAAMKITLSGLKHAAQSIEQNRTSDALVSVTDPRVVLPIYAAVLSSGMSAASKIFAQPVLPSLYGMLERPFLIVLILIVPGFFLARRHKAALQGQFIPQPCWKRLLKFIGITGATAIVVLAIIVVNVLTGVRASKLPEAMNMMNHEHLDEGGGVPTLMAGQSMNHHDHNNHQAVDQVEVASLTGDLSAPATAKFELVAQQREIMLASGAKVNTWTYNGEISPELRVKHGDIVEVVLSNKDIDRGVTVHWHGYNVPNAMDGVPGMTQNVVKPGQSFIYKFKANQEGTYWFHSHQQASEQVEKGLFGTLIVEPREDEEVYDRELTLINHRWETDQGKKVAFGNQDSKQLQQVEAGKKVKLRIINTHNQSRKYLLQGTSFQVTSIDGVRIQDPDRLTDQTAIRIASGGRYDVVFTMPEHPVQFKIGDYSDDDDPTMIFYTNAPPSKPSFKEETELFDPSDYGKPIVNELTSTAKFDRKFIMILGNKMGFYDGRFSFLWTINGEVHPNTPTFVVKEGERVSTTFVNKSLTEHPMHLHGHHMTVLKKNGKNVATPWKTDTLNVQAGESYEVAFIADNPGMWMDHCHNLDHAKSGMILHLMYDNVVPSYEVGTRSGNLPD